MSRRHAAGRLSWASPRFWIDVAILIFAVGAGVSIYKGVHHLVHPVAIESPYLNYIVLALAMLFEGAAWYFALTEFTKAKGKWGYLKAVQRGKDPSMFVVLFEDSAAMLGLIVAAVGIFLSQITANPIYDGLASIIIGLILAALFLKPCALHHSFFRLPTSKFKIIPHSTFRIPHSMCIFLSPDPDPFAHRGV